MAFKPHWRQYTITTYHMCDSTFICPIKELTHLVIDTTCSSRLNEHIQTIEDEIYKHLGVNYQCLFTYDTESTPKMFVPNRDPARMARAEQMMTAIMPTSSPICFEIPPGGGFASFDIIDIIAKIGHCSIYSNVSSLKFFEDTMPSGEHVRILVLGYDVVDD